jgi:hypothetical protein
MSCGWRIALFAGRAIGIAGIVWIGLAARTRAAPRLHDSARCYRTGSCPEPGDTDAAGMDPLQQPRVVFAYLPVPFREGGQPASVSGGAAIVVSPSALVAIRASIADDSGRLPRSARSALERIDDREARATELGILIRALGRRDVYVRETA